MALPGKSRSQGSGTVMDKEMKKNAHIGSSLDDLLKEEGIFEVTRAVSLKETLAWQAEKSIKKVKRD
jgi:hypothetical protein